MPATYHGIYSKRSDEVGQNATLSLTAGTANSAYPVANLVDKNPAKVCKIDSTNGTILFTFGAAQRVDLVSLIHTNLSTGATVKVQAATSSGFGSVAFEATFTIPAMLGSGVTRWPVNPWLDLTLDAEYSATGWQYWRITITGNAENIQIGQVWLGSNLRKFDPNVEWGLADELGTPSGFNRTAYNVAHLRRRASMQWRRTMALEGAPDTQRDAMLALVYDVEGNSFPWLVIPDGTVNEARMVRFAEPKQRIIYKINNNSRIELPLEELSRGLRPGS